MAEFMFLNCRVGPVEPILMKETFPLDREGKGRGQWNGPGKPEPEKAVVLLSGSFKPRTLMSSEHGPHDSPPGHGPEHL